jgi:hypothetical protein
MKVNSLPHRYTRFAGLRAKCSCGAVWSLRGCVAADEASAGSNPGASFPLFEVRCTCGGVALGFVPRGSVASTIRATPAA